MSFKQN